VIKKITRIHFDLVGGIAGDMFVAALADTFPELAQAMIEGIEKFPQSSKGRVEFVKHHDGILEGLRFDAIEHTHSHHHDDHGHSHNHDHVQYAHICTLLKNSSLKAEVISHALNLFSLLAKAESQVHGIKPEEVSFHEVGAWDSIIDFVAAAYFIDALGSMEWTFSALPIGGGTVKTAHGLLPVPAPATAILMQGISVVDDGIQGERVTPTGATIVKYLLSISKPHQFSSTSISNYGNGFGSKKLANISNVLRCLAFEATEQSANHDHISTITFEIDDQTSEDLAIGLDALRQCPGVIEVYQGSLFGKKGRMLTQVQILVKPDALESVCEQCFIETSTLGLRISKVERKILSRSEVSLEQPKSRVKIAKRPNNEVTAKAEISDIAAISSSASQRSINKQISEQQVLKKDVK
jgi:uncharacterized protein (TIGR00299 family) protein